MEELKAPMRLHSVITLNHIYINLHSPEALISHYVSSMTKLHAGMQGSSPASSVGQ